MEALLLITIITSEGITSQQIKFTNNDSFKECNITKERILKLNTDDSSFLRNRFIIRYKAECIDMRGKDWQI